MNHHDHELKARLRLCIIIEMTSVVTVFTNCKNRRRVVAFRGSHQAQYSNKLRYRTAVKIALRNK